MEKGERARDPTLQGKEEELTPEKEITS